MAEKVQKLEPVKHINWTKRGKKRLLNILGIPRKTFYGLIKTIDSINTLDTIQGQVQLSFIILNLSHT